MTASKLQWLHKTGIYVMWSIQDIINLVHIVYQVHLLGLKQNKVLRIGLKSTTRRINGSIVVDEPEYEFKNGDEVKNIYDSKSVYVVLQPVMGKCGTIAYLVVESESSYVHCFNESELQRYGK